MTVPAITGEGERKIDFSEMSIAMSRLVRSQVLHPLNGVNHFILPVHTIEFYYCPHYGCSKGMREFLRQNAYNYAERYPQVQFVVFPRKSVGPGIRASYMNGHQRYVGLSNREPGFIEEHLNLLISLSGSKPHRFRESVFSSNPAVRPIWSPFHDDLNCPLYK